MVDARKDAGHVHAHRLAQVVVDKRQHLERLVDAHGPLLQAVVVAQSGHATGVHARHGRAAEIDGNAIRLFVVESFLQPLAAGPETCIAACICAPLLIALRSFRRISRGRERGNVPLLPVRVERITFAGDLQ